ncbi:pyrroline-5-carboxylate reductase family protein [Methanothermobacter sp.]|uniref:pyrroline-5-carboxylate reductase family protein n=1 Tax=Methanothermobacter sp. TaxID=1884223 RepID=UPI003C709D99
MRISFLGGGRVVRIILGGLKRADELPGNVTVCDPDEDALRTIEDEFGVETSQDCMNIDGDVIFLAVHPPILRDLLEMMESPDPRSIVVSLAPRISIHEIQEALSHQRVVRVIPNAPSIVNRGYNPFSPADELTETDRKTLRSIFEPLGEFPEVSEDELEAYAVITAMGPTYLWFQLRELEVLGMEFGMDSQEAAAAVHSMAAGAVEALYTYSKSDDVMDLIPVKPLKDSEDDIRAIYHEKLRSLYRSLKE